MKITGWSLIRFYTIFVYVFMFAPIVVVVLLSFNPQQFGSFPMHGVSYRWYVKLAQNDTILEAFKNSLILGSLTAVVATSFWGSRCCFSFAGCKCPRVFCYW
jgi:spermidine/putrescine transport system permease protein